MADLLVEVAGGVAVVTLNRPQAMNALSKSLRAQIAETMRALDADDSVRAVVITGVGTRAFTAGLDLKELGNDAGAISDATTNDPQANPVKAIELCQKPVIGAINGVAITGGFEVALACDVLIASENARFADTHARVGIMPGWGLSQKLSRIVGLSRAKELSLTGNFIDAATAERWGLVNRVVPATELISEATALARDMAGIETNFIQAYKKLIDDGYATGLTDGLLLEHKRSTAANASVKAADVEAQRAAVQARGRGQ